MDARDPIHVAARELADGDAILCRPFVFVTGKGGVGTTMVAAAIALAGGGGTLLCGEHEPPLDPLVSTLEIEPEPALGEWLARHVGGAAAALLRRSRAFTYFFAASPGAAELVTLGKAMDHARQRGPVVFDAPATGHGLAMLAAPRTFAGLSPLGPVAREAAALETRLADPSFSAYVGVTAPEEMAVAELETLERSLPEVVGRALDLVVVNGVHPDRFTDAEAERLRALDADHELDAVLAEHRCARRQAAQVQRVRELTGAPVITVPFVFPAPTRGRPRAQRGAAMTTPAAPARRSA